MKVLGIIGLCLLAAWWGLLTAHAIICHRRRIQLAATWTPENEKEYRQFVESMRWNRAQRKPSLLGYLLGSPFIFLLLPYFLCDWLVKDPFDEHNHDA